MQKSTEESRAKKAMPQEMIDIGFEREGRVGFNFLDVKSGKPLLVTITGLKEHTNKEGKLNTFWEATDLVTGEDGMIYIDGGLKGAAQQLGGLDKVVGLSLEITHKGHSDIELEDGTDARVNLYDVFKLRKKN